MLIVLALVAVLLPVLLFPSTGPDPLPPPPTSHADEHVSAAPTPRETEASEAISASPERIDAQTPADSGEVAAPEAAVAAGPLPPIVERRRVHGGRPAPQSNTEPGLPKAARDDEWDRSPEARQRAVETFGGTVRTETAVEAGLAWLAAHQSPDGTWDRFHFKRQCPPDDVCSGAALERTGQDLKAGVSGLALLAFLGAGYTDGDGPYQDVVSAAVAALLKLQEPHGGFSRQPASAGYNDALATLALAEYFALTQEPRVVEPLRRAVARLVGSQQTLGGWDYLPTPNTGRNDSSITAWMVQALHSCAAAGIEVPPRTLVRAALHFTRAAGEDGRVWYADSGEGFQLDRDLRPVHQYGLAMLAAGLMCEQMLGWRLVGSAPLRQRSVLLGEPPSASKLRLKTASLRHSEYYWYYGTLAMFQRGGDDWASWNARLRDTLLPLQNREKNAHGDKRHQYGSWPPYGQGWGMAGLVGGCVYSTAICTLTLETYYRHTPAFLRDEVHFAADDWRSYLAGCRPRERREVVACLRQLRVEIAEPVLVDLLDDDDRRIALSAAEALARLDSPVGIPVIEELITTLPAWEQVRLKQLLQRGQAVLALPPAEGHVRLYDPATGLATLDLPRSYVGMNVSIERDGLIVARMRVIQRFTGRTVVVAETVENIGPSAPQAGDQALGR
ncbi:MAG: terpene cyclase/mutase family protein [Phycisphaerae bacterium]|nr:terpene cyclase/mutase family protein [Phycisphaerae bacterium]